MTALPADTSSTGPSVRWCGLAFRSHEQGSTIALGDVGRRNRAAAEEMLADGEVRDEWRRKRRRGMVRRGLGKPDVPRLYIARRCEYFWGDRSFSPPDPRRVEDVDSRGPDHAADARRYALLRDQREVMTHDMF